MASSLTLKVYRGDDLVRTERFARDIIKIGRLSSAHLCLDDERLSRIHSVIEVAPDGTLSIIDMGSANGTYVNGKRVNRSPLRFGDEITLGGLRIVLEGTPPEAAPSANAAVEEKAGGPSVDVSMDEAPPPEPIQAVEVAPAGSTNPEPAAQPDVAPPEAAPTATAAPIRDSGPRSSVAPAAMASAAAARKGRAKPGSPVATESKTEARAPAASRPKTDLDSIQLTPAPPTAPAARAPAPRSASAVPAPEEPVGLDAGVELRMLWGETLLGAGTYVKPSRPVLVGETKRCDFLLYGPELPSSEFAILRYEEGEYRFLFARRMNGGIEEKGKVTPLGTLVKERKASPDGAVEGVYAAAVPRGGTARVEFGAGVRMEARLKKPPKLAAAPWTERINYQFLNLFLLLLFLLGGFVVASANFPYDTDTLADDLFKNPSRMAKFIIKPPEQLPKSNPYLERLQKELKNQDPGEAAERHKGTEGQMGKKEAPKTNARSAPKAIDPNAKDIVKNSGLLGVLGRGRGGSSGLSTIFGQGGLGGDLKGAIGNMFGPVVGDSQGLGGLGLKGTGTGGGGQGETIGIGGVGTKGRGGGLGGGSGYGAGVGNLGKKSDREVSVATGPIVVVGYDRELVRRVVQEHAAQIRYCYEQALAVNPKLEGKVAIRWIINSDGRVSNTQIVVGTTTLDSTTVHRCMMDRVSSWEFPKPKGGSIADITYPWILRPSGSAG
jgi:pSer/pThr/pTyr-binding forkhead associated (FHA) protein